MFSALLRGFAQMTVSSLSSFTATAACQPGARTITTSVGGLWRKLDTRAYPPYRLPTPRKNRWEPRLSFDQMYEYTIKPLPFPKTGGRGPNGRIWNHKRGGGHKRRFRMIDWVRQRNADGKLHVERVQNIIYDPNRSARIALVVNAEHKRYIIATQNMKRGDIIHTSEELTKSPVRPVEGNSHPLGSLPVGTLVNCVERFPGLGGKIACAAGVTAQLVRKQDDTCVVRMPSKREIIVSSKCMATVGRVSNIDHNKRVIGKAGRNRWLGIRPRSGRWHRKIGRFGRKIKPIKKPLNYVNPPPEKQIHGRFTVGRVPAIYNSTSYGY